MEIIIIYFTGSFIAMGLSYREMRETDEDVIDTLGMSFLAFFLSWVSIIVFYISYLLHKYRNVDFSERVFKIFDTIFMVNKK